MQAVFKTCCKTLTAYCRNVYMNLEDPAKRRINGENKAFQQRVAAVDGGRDFLCEVGFQVRHCSHGHGPDSAAKVPPPPPPGLLVRYCLAGEAGARTLDSGSIYGVMQRLQVSLCVSSSPNVR